MSDDQNLGVQKIFRKKNDRNSPHATPQKFYLPWSLISSKVPKNRTPLQLFSCEFCEILKENISIEHLWAVASGCTKVRK